jgi:hypothetical protein
MKDLGVGDIDPEAAVRVAGLLEALFRELPNLRRLKVSQEQRLHLVDCEGGASASDGPMPSASRLPG